MKRGTVKVRKRKGMLLRKCLAVVLSVALMVTMMGILPGSYRPAQAADELSSIAEQPILLVSGQGLIADGSYTESNISNERSYTLEDLQDLEEITQLYSAINTTPTKSIYLGKGISVGKLLQESGISTSDSGDIEIDIISSDGYTIRFDPAKTGDSATKGRPLLTPAFNVERYYYPNLKELTVALNGENYVYSNEEAAAVGAQTAKTILAWERGGDRGYPEIIPTETGGLPEDEKPLLLMVGQQNVHEQNNPLFNKAVKKILVGPALETPLITIDGEDYTRGEILMMERADREYTYQTKGGEKTDYVRGVPLAVLLEEHADDEIVSFTAADGYDMSGASVTVGEAIANNYMLAYEKGSNVSDLAGIFDTDTGNTVQGYFTLYGDNIKPSKLIDSITVNPAGYVDYSDSPYKHINNGGLTGSAPYNIDAITGATLTVEGPGVEATTPIRMGDLEATNSSNIYRGSYTDLRDSVSTTLNYEGVKVLSIIDGLVNSTVEKVDDNITIIFKNRWRQDIGSITYYDLSNAETPVILAYGTGELDESKIAPFVFDGDTGYVEELGNDDGCIKLVYDRSEFPNLSDSDKFVSVAYLYVERGDGRPGYKHSAAADDAYRNTANMQQLITFTGSALGYEVNYTVEELEAMVEYEEDGRPESGGLGHRAEYNLSNTTYWYVNEYEGVKLWDLLTRVLGVDAEKYAADEDTLVSFAAWDNYQTTAQFSMAQLADPDRFYFYEKSPLDIGTNRPTKAQLATPEYQPDNRGEGWTTDSNGYPVKKGYPVMLAYGVNGYPYVRDSRLPGYAGGLGNDGGPIRVIFGKTDGMNRSNLDALENYAYFYNNGSNQLQRAQEIYVGDDTRYSTHLENPNYADMKNAPALTVEIKQGGTTNTVNYSLAELESILYGPDVTKSEREKQGRQEKGYYAHKVYNNNLLEDLFEGVNLWYLLSEEIGMQGVLGTVSLYSGTSETSSVELSLAELQEKGFNSLRDTEGLGAMVAFAKNGYPMVSDKSSAGYVDTNTFTGKTIKNSDGPLMFVRAQTAGQKAEGDPGDTVKNLTKIVVNLEPDVYAHTDGDYLAYADNEVDFSGAVKNEGVTLTVSDIEKMQKYMVTDTYTVGGTTSTFRGVDLSRLLSSPSVGASALMNEIEISNGTDTKTLTVADLQQASKPVILAYGIGKDGGDPAGKPLVPDIDSEGYDAEYLNSGGPLRLIIDGAAGTECITNVSSITVTAAELSGWTHSTGHYAVYKDHTLQLSGTNLARSVTMTVEELESLPETYKVFDQYKMGNNYYFEGIDLLKLFRDHIGFAGDLQSSNFTVYAKDNYAITFTATDLTNGVNGKPIILAYGQGTSSDRGLPLVDGDDQNDVRDGFDPNIGNAFGPLRLVVNDNTGWCNKWVTSIVVGSGGSQPPEAVDFRLTNGSQVTNYSIRNIKSITQGSGGQATASYSYTVNSESKTDYVKGIYLSDFLAAAGISGDQAKVTVNTTDGFESKQASYRDISLAELAEKDYFLAYDAGSSAESLTAISDTDKNEVEATVRIYRNYDDGSTWQNRMTNISGITVTGADVKYIFDVYKGTAKPGELPMASVRDIVTDASGGMWVGTNGGGAWYKPADSDVFTINTLATEGYILGSDVVQAMAVDSTGGIWFSQSKTYNPAEAHLNKGAAYVKDGSITYYSTAQAGTIPNDYVQEVKIDASGNVWFGSFGGLTRYNPTTGTWDNWNQSYQDEDGDRFPAVSVDNIHFENNGGVWLGFYPTGAGSQASPFIGGFAHMTADGDITPYQFTADYDSELGSSLLAQVWVRDIAVDQNGGAWVVASGSYTDLHNVGGTVWYVDNQGNVTEFTGDELLGAGKLTGNNEIRMVSIDNLGGLWIGTSGDGLYYVADPEPKAPLTITAQYSGANNAWPNTWQFNNIYALNIIDDVMYLGSDAGVMVAALEEIIPAPEPVVIGSFTVSGVGDADILYYVGGSYDRTFKKLPEGAGQVESSYPYNGTTHYVKGALLSTLLGDVGAGENIKITIVTSDGYTKDSYQNISYADIVSQQYFVAYDVGEGTESLAEIADEDNNGVTASFRIYRNYDSGQAGQKENRIKGVVGINVSTPGSGGGEIPDRYDLMITGAGVSQTTYLTIDQLKHSGYVTTRSYNWLNNYGTTGSDTFKGIYLEDLLKNMVGLNSKAQSITVTASDGYYKNFNLDSNPLGIYWTDIQGNKMMLAWERNGSSCSLQLVVGQKDAQHVNKSMWVSDIEFITVNSSTTQSGTGSPDTWQKPQEEPQQIVEEVKPGTTVANGTATTNVSLENVKEILDSLQNSQTEEDFATTTVEINALSDGQDGSVNNASVHLSADALQALADAGSVAVKIKTDLGEIVLPPEVVQMLAAQGTESVVINLNRNDTAALNEEARSKVGDRPVIDITISAGSQNISDFNSGQVEVYIPYESPESENSSSLLVYYIDENGENVPVILSRYDEETGRMVFVTPHLSLYAVGYNEVKFNDVEGHWAQDNIQFLAAREVLKGKKAGVFDPDGSVTRAEFITMLANLIDRPSVAEAGNTRFKDVSAGDWYAGYVNWAVTAGIVSGYGDGRFGPNDQITREQMAVMMDNFLKAIRADLAAVNEESIFTDQGQISNWAAAAVKRMQQAGLVNGRPDGSFAPQGTTTRAEAATVIKGYIDLQ